MFDYSTLGDSGFFQASRYQGIVKSTVSVQLRQPTGQSQDNFNFGPSLLKGLSSKPSGKMIVAPNLCFLNQRLLIVSTCLFFISFNCAKFHKYWTTLILDIGQFAWYMDKGLIQFQTALFELTSVRPSHASLLMTSLNM